MTSNQLAYWANQEKIRSNKVMEAETARHNKEMERVGYAGAAASQLGAQASMLNARNAQAALAETTRHNQAMEDYQSYSAYSGGMASMLQAQAATTRAETDKSRYGLEKEMLPYDKWVKGTTSLRNVAGSIADILGLATNRAKIDLEKEKLEMSGGSKGGN